VDSKEPDSQDSFRATRALVTRGAASALIVRIAAAAATLVMNIVLARLLGTSEYGIVSLGLSWLTIAGVFSCFGTDSVALRFVAEGLKTNHRDQVGHVIGWGRRLSTLAGIAAALASIGLIELVFHDFTLNERFALWLIVSATPLLALSLNNAGVLRAAKRIALGVSIEMLMRPIGILGFVLVLVAVYGSSIPLIGVAVGVLIAQAFPAFFGIGKARGLIVQRNGKIPPGEARRWTRVAGPIALMNVMGILMANLDVIMVGYFVSAASAGIYRASAQFAGLVAFGLAASNAIVAPLIAELFSSGQRNELRAVLRYSVAMVTVGSIAAVLFMGIFGSSLLGIFGYEFRGGYQALLILLVGQTMNALCGPTGFLMTMTGHEYEAMRIFVVATVVNILLNLALVPTLGLVGGAIANAVGISMWNLMILVFLRGRLRIDPSILSWSPMRLRRDGN
jgi:O-antigen/teichoic acid export membrane protein